MKYFMIIVTRKNSNVKIYETENPKTPIDNRQIVMNRTFENPKEAYCIAQMYMEQYLSEGNWSGIGSQ